MIPRRVYGSFVVAATVRGQRAIPFEAREKIEARRDRRVRAIVRHAARTVPWYRDWFRREGVDPQEITGAAELERLPILDRELVRAKPHLFLTQGREGRGALQLTTSGTTGSPLRLHHDRRSLLANFGFGERERQPVIALCGGSLRPKELSVGYENATFKKVTGFYAANTALPVRARRRFISVAEPLDRIVEALNEERPEVLVGYGGWVGLLFNTIAARGISVHRPKVVVYVGEGLPPGARTLIEGEFGIPVLSRYNAMESFKIGFQCEHRTGFHLHDDLCWLRAVGPGGETVPPGVAGEVVISNLVNRATVLLNHPLGDVASISPSPCPCGRTLRVLSELEGRTEDVLALSDGRFIHPRSIWGVFKEDREVLQYQLTQVEPERFELALVTADEAAFRRVKERSLPMLREVLGKDAVIEPSRRTTVRPPADGKFRAVASRIGAPPGRDA